MVVGNHMDLFLASFARGSAILAIVSTYMILNTYITYLT